jgi:hypothetical protein
VTVGVHIAPPGEIEEPDGAKVLTGTAEEDAAGLRAYAEAGVGHVIVGALAHSTAEYTGQVIAHTAAALQVYRAGG